MVILVRGHFKPFLDNEYDLPVDITVQKGTPTSPVMAYDEMIG